MSLIHILYLICDHTLKAYIDKKRKEDYREGRR